MQFIDKADIKHTIYVERRTVNKSEILHSASTGILTRDD